MLNTDKKKHILAVFGTRPEAVKMCPLIKELQKRPGLEIRVAVTGQHRELLDSVLEVFGIVPDYDFNLFEENRSVGALTAEILNKLEPLLDKEKPDIVLVHGDTCTAYASALACFYKGIPVGHVEAGLRTYDLHSPFPEEFFRQSIDKIADFCFCPTESAAHNLLIEGKEEEKIFVTGNTAVDALRYTLCSDFSHPLLEKTSGKRLILITLHRRESIGQPMKMMCAAIRKIMETHPDCLAILPVHPNPEVKKTVTEELAGAAGVILTEPLELRLFHKLESLCYLALTDSGGIQEECPSFGKPVLIMREKTERLEGILAGNAELIGTDTENIYREVCRILDDKAGFNRLCGKENPYGDGHAGERIADIVENAVL